MILTLLLLTLPVDIKAQTQQHLMAMNNISATETIGKNSHRVAMFGGQQAGARPPTYHGVYVDRAWWVLLRDSQVWRWEDVADDVAVGMRVRNGDHLYLYRDVCAFTEKDKIAQVPCSGTIEVAGLDVRSITQTLETGKWGAVLIDIRYGWVTLSEPRLVPTELTLKWRGGEIKARWGEYRELRATEPKISEWSEGNEARATDQTGASSSGTDNSAESERETINQPATATLSKVEGVGLQSPSPAGLLTLPSDSQLKRVRIRKWWKVWQ